MIGTLVVLVVAVYVGSCLLAGYGPPAPLARFSADGQPLVRRFADPAAAVVAAYRRAAAAAPGMRIAEEGGNVLLIDSRPTPRVLGGAFGLALRLRFADGGEGSTVTAPSRSCGRFPRKPRVSAASSGSVRWAPAARPWSATGELGYITSILAAGRRVTVSRSRHARGERV